MSELTQLTQFTHYSPELDCYFHLSGGDALYWCCGKWEPASVSKQTKARCVPKYDNAASAPVVDWVNAPMGSTMVSRESGIFYRMYNHRFHYFADGEWREVLQGLDKVTLQGLDKVTLQGLDKVTLENLLANPIPGGAKATVKVDWASAPQETTHYDPKNGVFYWLGCHRAHFWDGSHWKHCIMAEHTPTYERLIENPVPMRPAPAEPDPMPETAQVVVDHASNTAFTMDCAGYEKLAEVLQAAFDQASSGKGKERHATSLNGGEVPFHEQPMQQIGRRRGIGFILGQADKKSEEAQGMLERGDVGAFEREILGAIVYLAGSIIFAKSGE